MEIGIFIAGISMVGDRFSNDAEISCSRLSIGSRRGHLFALVSFESVKRYANFQLSLDAGEPWLENAKPTNQSTKPRAKEHNGVVIR